LDCDGAKRSTELIGVLHPFFSAHTKQQQKPSFSRLTRAALMHQIPHRPETSCLHKAGPYTMTDKFMNELGIV
jgi:hypothetical protein